MDFQSSTKKNFPFPLCIFSTETVKEVVVGKKFNLDLSLHITMKDDWEADYKTVIDTMKNQDHLKPLHEELSKRLGQIDDPDPDVRGAVSNEFMKEYSYLHALINTRKIIIPLSNLVNIVWALKDESHFFYVQHSLVNPNMTTHFKHMVAALRTEVAVNSDFTAITKGDRPQWAIISENLHKFFIHNVARGDGWPECKLDIQECWEFE